ncbi:MAG: pseudoazurin [Pseudomonadota bacterium]
MLTRRKFVVALAALPTTALARNAVPDTVDGKHSVLMLNADCNDANVINVFDPAILRVEPGDSVKFLATDGGHNAASKRGMIPDGAEPWNGSVDEEIEVTLTVPGIYGYICLPHYEWGMVGLIVVGNDLHNLKAAKKVRHPGDARKNFRALLKQFETESLDPSMADLVNTWSKLSAQEDGMADEHAWIWREMINAVSGDLSQADVLDFGCNQGGFLRTFYDTRPFANGVGVDLAQDRVALAEAAKGDRPLQHFAMAELTELESRFDVAFSHEVIYLIEDLGDHARQTARVLKPGATYHAVTCCHADNPLWPRWRPMIQEFSNIPAPDHSVDDILSAFRAAGFATRVSRFLAASAVPAEGPNDFFPTDLDRLEVYANWKLMFHFTI